MTGVHDSELVRDLILTVLHSSPLSYEHLRLLIVCDPADPPADCALHGSHAVVGVQLLVTNTPGLLSEMYFTTSFVSLMLYLGSIVILSLLEFVAITSNVPSSENFAFMFNFLSFPKASSIVLSEHS